MKNVKLEQQYMLSLVGNVLFQTPFNAGDFANIDYNYVSKKVDEQKFDVLIYNAMTNNDIHNKYYDFLTKRNYQLMILTSNQENEYQAISKLFDDNNIDYVPLKGTYMKHFYPAIDMRLMGDIDILIHEEQRDLVTKLLTENGYELEDNSHSAHHDIYNYGKYGHFEIHFRLLDQINEKRDNIDKMVWNHTSNHRFDNEFNIVYLLAHYANHFIHGGASYKSMLDIGLLLYKENIDYEKLKELLLETDLYNFYNNVVSLLNYSFNLSLHAYENKLSDDEIEELINFLFVCGDFGFGDENDSEKVRVVYEMSKKKKVTIFSKLWYIIKQVCIPYRTFKHLSKVIKYCPILLPFGWVVRLLKFLIFKRKRAKEKLSGINKVSNDDLDNFRIVHKMID